MDVTSTWHRSLSIVDKTILIDVNEIAVSDERNVKIDAFQTTKVITKLLQHLIVQLLPYSSVK
jgi:hypothetical protein